MSIMLVALLVIGGFLFWQGKFNFGSIQTEGATCQSGRRNFDAASRRLCPAKFCLEDRIW
jgi:hypothetical protein